MIQFDSFMQAEGVPIYQQIIRYVKQGIAAGTIRDGESDGNTPLFFVTLRI